MIVQDKLEIYSLSIVFVGEFNPVIVQPFWLANKKLIREQEGEEAKVELIHNELVRFELDWVKLEITKQRFEFTTSKEPYFEPCRDLATSIFTILKETPIRALGINHLLHYRFENEDKYYEIGNKIASLDKWSTFLKLPRLLNFEIVEQKRSDNEGGYVRIAIQPSDRISNSVMINVNDHFELRKGESDRSGKMLNLLLDNWGKSFDFAKDTVNNINKIIS
jgi:hypothetical protein